MGIFRSMDEQQKVLLTSWIVEQRRLGAVCPNISSATFNNVKVRRPCTVHERADNLLRYLVSKSELLGSVVEFSQKSAPKVARKPMN